MAWGGPVEPSVRRDSWKKEIRRGPRPGDEGPYESTTAVRDRVMAMTFGTQVAFGIGFGVLIVGATVFYAQYSGALRWVLGVVLLSGVAYFIVRFVGARGITATGPTSCGTFRCGGGLWGRRTECSRRWRRGGEPRGHGHTIQIDLG